MILQVSIQLGFDKVHKLADGAHLFFHLQVHAQLFFQIHQHFNGVQRVQMQALESGLPGDAFGGNIQLLGQIGAQSFQHFKSSVSPYDQAPGIGVKVL